MRITWTNAAAEDLRAVHAYLGERSTTVASRTIAGIVRAVARLPDYPGSGRIVPEFQLRSLRELIVPLYRVIYLRSPDGIEILAVLHSSRRFPD